jgi:hypothetical protein
MALWGHRFRGLSGGSGRTDCGEIVRGQRFSSQEHIHALIEVGAPRLQDVIRPVASVGETAKSFSRAPASAAAETGRRSMEAMIGAQKELFETFEQINRDWFDRLKAETDLAAEFFSKLVTARTIPDAAMACQECANRRMQILAEDGKRFVAAGEKFFPRLVRSGLSGVCS